MKIHQPPVGGLSREMLDGLAVDGYVVLRGLLTAAQVERARVAIDEILASRKQQIRLRHTRSREADGSERWDYYDFEPNDRSARSREADTLVAAPGLRIQGEPGSSATAGGDLRVRKIENYRDVHPFFFTLLHDEPALREPVRAALGDQPLLYSCMALLKPPRGVEKPWHQDAAYFNVAPLSAAIGLWVAIDPATRANGCMHVAPGWHKRGAFEHVHRADCDIADPTSFAASEVPVPLDPGDALLFSPMLPHRTPANHTEQRRWALQLHYRGAASTLVRKVEYDRLFATADGLPASCFTARHGDAGR